MNECEGPVAPQSTSPRGSVASEPNASAVVETDTTPCVPVPVTGSGVGSGVHSASEVVSAIVAGEGVAGVGVKTTFIVADTPPLGGTFCALDGVTLYPAAPAPPIAATKLAAGDPEFPSFVTVNPCARDVPMGAWPNRKLGAPNESWSPKGVSPRATTWGGSKGTSVVTVTEAASA